MKKKSFRSFTLFASVFALSASKASFEASFEASFDPKLQIIVNTPFNTPEKAKIFITGDFKNCRWQVRCEKMKRLSKNTFEFVFENSEENFEFKITRGHWDRQAANADGSELRNYSFSKSKNPAPIVIDVINWKDLGPLKRMGRYQVFNNFYSPQLNNYRSISVWLPPGYSRTKRYPVVYAHDGQNLFDPKAARYGVDWGLDDVMTELIAEQKIRPAIVVGIHHLKRGREFNDADRGHEYTKFIVETLKPFIDRSFQTLRDRENTFLLGSSFGGVISTTTLWRYPHIFSKAAALSVKTHAFDRMLFDFIQRHPTPQNVDYYMDNGTWGIDQGYIQPNRTFAQQLQFRGFPEERLQHLEFHWAQHNEAAWARRLHVPLKFLLGR